MGLSSVFSTAVTGLQASETTIDVAGNNVANANTVGFKSSDVVFATQFLQTLSLGSAPTNASGGTNPKQIGVGTQVAAITPNFSQGTIQISSNPSDLAIQGDGFFIVRATTGEQLYTRNGQFQVNSGNELVTITGDRLLGFGVDENFQIQATTLEPINIPLGSAAVAKSTENVFLEGTLTPTGDVADTAQIIQTGILGDGQFTRPAAAPTLGSGGVGLLTGNYSYYVTFADTAGGPGVGLESRPSPLSSSLNVVGNQIDLSSIPTDGSGQWAVRRIYRNLSTDDSVFHYVGEIADNVTTTFTDNIPDATITSNALIDLEGPRIGANTLLTNVLQRNDTVYEQRFKVGTLNFTGRKGDRQLATKTLAITSTTTVLDLVNFMEDALGIQDVPGPDPSNPIPVDLGSGANPGGSVTVNGQIRIIGNNGTENKVDIGLSGLQLTTTTGMEQVNLPFGVTQSAKGQSAVADVVVFDSLGIPLNVRVTTVLEKRTGTQTTYRWFADSPDNDPTTGVNIDIGTGLISFDGEGKFLGATDTTVSIDRRNIPSSSPLEFDLDFSQVSGLAATTASLAATRQDGFSAGKLTSFIISEDGLIRGVFDNGSERSLGQIRLGRFANAQGLEQRGQNLFAAGVNSGLPVQASPGEQGVGQIISGAVELSNTDIGGNLIDLILASTQYRGNTRVISTAQQLLDELLNLRR